MYWSVPPSVWPITTGRTPRRVIVRAENGVSAATRGAAWAGAARTAVERRDGKCGKELHGGALGYPKNLC